MSEADIQLLLTALGGVALLVALIVTRIRMHPLLALLVVSLAVGIAAGMDIASIAGATVAGAGHTLGVVGIVIALGAMLGKILADSGVTEAIATGHRASHELDSHAAVVRSPGKDLRPMSLVDNCRTELSY